MERKQKRMVSIRLEERAGERSQDRKLAGDAPPAKTKQEEGAD